MRAGGRIRCPQGRLAAAPSPRRVDLPTPCRSAMPAGLNLMIWNTCSTGRGCSLRASGSISKWGNEGREGNGRLRRGRRRPATTPLGLG
ncbi:hypothetical protein PAHAL_4G210800 [Panicum hallii]|uniref:Uncharacterized protein n=1 Tax=Panicum hallii TaxID=206008 RepID=A0A2T8JDJ4_9POAL|nr:hypothetical protein PAHAL_4G210800 [Panicum hallii]